MGDSPDNGMGDGEETESGAFKASEDNAAGTNGGKAHAKAFEHRLPVVWSPKLDTEQELEPAVPDAEEFQDFEADAATASSDDGMAEETAGEGTGDPAAPPKQPRSTRFALLAATIALAAAFGSFVGSISASGLLTLFHEATPASRSEEFSATVQAMKAQYAELSGIKSDLDSASRTASTQFAKIADRLDRVERAEADPAAKLSHIADAVDRLGKQAGAAPETTGSITPNLPPASDAKPADKFVDGWIVEDVHAGQALVASRHGGEFVVGPGSTLPGLGAVEAVKRQDGQWIVLTARGVIASGH